MVFEKCSERFGVQNHFLFGDLCNQMEKGNSYLIFGREFVKCTAKHGMCALHAIKYHVAGNMTSYDFRV